MEILNKLRDNWKSGVTVALVSIPLSVSLAVASQTSPVVGIITAVWAGLFAALFGGSNFNIVGPTGALSGILAAYAIAHGAGSLAMLAVVAGVMILVAYAFKLERFLVFVPGSTILGFTIGVAFIITLNQLNFALGLQGLEKHEHFIENVLESLKHIGQASLPTVGVFIIFLILLFVLLRVVPRIPGAIILAPAGILLGYASVQGMVPVRLLTLGQQYPDLSAKLFLMPEFFFNRSLLITGLAVALVAILETMISAKIADGMTRTKHNARKEMLGLGLANVVTGLMGGIPATAALARTSLNIKSNATDRMSAVISSIAIAVISLVLLQYFVYIPLAVIAAILVFVAFRMVEMHQVTHLWKHDKKNFWLAMVVAAVTIYEDPIVGIFFGTAASLLLFMETLSRGYFDVVMNDINTGKNKLYSGEKLEEISKESHILAYSIKGQLLYINSKAHVSRFETNLSQYYGVVLRLRELHFIDTDGIDALDEIIGLIQKQGKPVVLSGVNSMIEARLKRELKAYPELSKKGMIYEKTIDGLRALGYEHLNQS
ncbi:MAG: SulP family inorganic anion transporter [Patescibacteria group bacterium]|nr:SulP family inorganic anion transporter [Patescibacteria group bacterium]